MNHCLVKSFAVLLVGSLVLWGCATIIHGSSQKVGIASTPTGATVWVDNQQVGITPVIASLKRGDEHIVRIELAGYQRS